MTLTYRSGEILFTELNRISDFLGFYVYGVTFVCTLLFLTGVFAFALTTPQPWLALAMVLPYLGFVIGMSGIRQAAAIGICYIALARWEKLSLAVKLGALAVAAGFHNSAVLLLPLILFFEQTLSLPQDRLDHCLVGGYRSRGRRKRRRCRLQPQVFRSQRPILWCLCSCPSVRLSRRALSSLARQIYGIRF